jgi:hypothetical protein
MEGEPMFYIEMLSFPVAMMVVFIIFTIYSGRQDKLNECLTPSDISKLDDEGKAIVSDYLKSNGVPITYAQFENEIEKRRTNISNKVIVESQVDALKKSPMKN